MLTDNSESVSTIQYVYFGFWLFYALVFYHISIMPICMASYMTVDMSMPIMLLGLMYVLKLGL
jgi:hypothetical protein